MSGSLMHNGGGDCLCHFRAYGDCDCGKDYRRDLTQLTSSESVCTMTPTAFAAALDDLDLSQVRFARLTGVHVTTVSRWATGGLPIPKWVPSWLDMCRRAGVPAVEE